MTDKQIIIDGVDVSGCEYYFDEKCRCMDASIMQDFYLCPQCNSNPNCHYKLYKCKEQECEELKKKYLELKEQNGSNIVQLNTVNEQLDQLKEELSVIQHNCNREGCRYYDDNTFKVFYECKAQKALQLSANSITTKYCDLLQTLTEIKEIAKNGCYDDCGMPLDELSIILQKIGEVEDGFHS